MAIVAAELLNRVIPPLREGLMIEMQLLAEGNCSWRFYNQKLEHLWKVRRYVPPDVRRLYDRWFVQEPRRFADLAEPHDRLLDSVREAATAAFEALKCDKGGLVEVAREWLEDYESRHPEADYPGGAYPRDQFPELVAERVVNCIREVPGHYADSAFWKEYGEKALEYGVGGEFEVLSEWRDRLHRCDRDLLVEIEGSTRNLAQQVPPASAGAR